MVLKLNSILTLGFFKPAGLIMCLHYLWQLDISFPAYIYFQIYLYLLSFTIPAVLSRLMFLFGHPVFPGTGKLSIY